MGGYIVLEGIVKKELSMKSGTEEYGDGGMSGRNLMVYRFCWGKTVDLCSEGLVMWVEGGGDRNEGIDRRFEPIRN